MGQMKRFAEEVSVQMGYDGEINDFVLEVAEAMFPQFTDEFRSHQSHKLGFENGCTLEDNKEEKENNNE
jgi:hypothetical protein